MQPIIEKRKSERYLMVRNVKVYDPRSRRYRAGQTLNVSDTGALLAVRHGEALQDGQPVQVLIDYDGAEGLVGRGQLRTAHVVRNEGAGGAACVVAVKFNELQPLSRAA